MAEHSDLRSLAVDHVIEADDLGSMISTETPSSASGSAFACGNTKRSLVVPSARSKKWSRMLRSITMMALPQPAIRCRFPSDTCSDMLRRKSRSDLRWLPRTGLRPRSPLCFPCLRPALPPAAPEQRSGPCAMRSDRLRRSFRRRRNRRSSTRRPSTGRIPRGKVKLRVQREVQLSAVHRSDSPAWSPALALTAAALVLGAVLAGLSKLKMSPHQRVVLHHHGVLAVVHPGGEVDQPSQRPPPGVQQSVPSVCTNPRRRVAGLQVERIRRTMLLRPAALRCSKRRDEAGCHSLQLILLLGTAPLCRAS